MIKLKNKQSTVKIKDVTIQKPSNVDWDSPHPWLSPVQLERFGSLTFQPFFCPFTVFLPTYVHLTSVILLQLHDRNYSLAQPSIEPPVFICNLTSVHASRFAQNRVEQVGGWQLPLCSCFSVEADDWSFDWHWENPFCLTYNNTNTKAGLSGCCGHVQWILLAALEPSKTACDKYVDKRIV